MTDLIFVDTNVVLYTLGEDERKKTVARNVLAEHPILSTQVVNEAVRFVCGVLNLHGNRLALLQMR